jgi:uncharacterized protein (TIGR00725 family)
MIHRRTIAVFGSALPAEMEEQYDTAYRLGCLLARNNFNVFTGGYKGIMVAVSKGVTENGGKATGVTLSYNKGPGNKYLTREIKCDTLFDRIKTLIESADAYIVLQGGTGTLLELAAIWEFMNKGLIPVKPVACHSSMWKDIGRIIDKQLEAEQRVTGLVKYFEDVEEIVGFLVKELG